VWLNHFLDLHNWALRDKSLKNPKFKIKVYLKKFFAQDCKRVNPLRSPNSSNIICFANENEDVTSKALLKSFLHKTAKASQMRIWKLILRLYKKHFAQISKKLFAQDCKKT
jgi:hypothetical protein